MTTLRTVLDRLIAAGVIVEQAEDGRLRLRACVDSSPITADTLELCREHKQLLMEYARFTTVADRLLLDSSSRIAKAWPMGCALFDDGPAWDDLEQLIHEAYWSMDLARLRYAIGERERHALKSIAAHEHTHDQAVDR
jgi:hypothetical protein